MSSNIPETQNAVVINETGGPEVLTYTTSHPVPKVIDTGKVLIKNNIIGINYIDTYFRTGLYPSPKPEVLGREAAGTVAALPEDYQGSLKVGDRVVFLGTSAYAQYTLTPAARVAKIPDNITDENAVGANLMGLTALSLSRETFEVKPGHWVLLHAAAGGVGQLFVQILKAKGAHVIATAGGPEKCEIVRKLGADVVIDYKGPGNEKWVEKVKAETPNGLGVDVVYDSVGKDTWEGSLEAVKRKGTVIYYGNASGPVPPMPLTKLSPKAVKIARPTLFAYIETDEEFASYVNELFELLGSGKLKVAIHKIYPLEDVKQAHIDLEGRGTKGKLLLKA